MSDNFFSEETINKIRKDFEKDIVRGGLMGKITTNLNIGPYPFKSIGDAANILHSEGFGLSPVKKGTEVEVTGENNQNLSRKEIIYRAGEIHAAFMMCALSYMKEWKTGKTDEKEKLRNERLKRLGFTSSATMKTSDEKMKSGLRAECFRWFEDHFNGCIFLKINDFISLLKKYNLVCGPLGAYIGDVLDDNLEEIVQTADMLERVKEDNPYSNKIDKDIFYSIVTQITEYHPFALIPERKGTDEQISEALRFPFNSEPISAIASLSDKIIKSTQTKSTDLFIAAPAQDMKTEVKIRHQYIRSEDPFVFQLTPYGVVIYSKWGKEAEDEMVNPY